MKPLFSNQYQIKQNITIVKNNSLIQEDQKVSEIFNDFFQHAAQNLGIQKNMDILNKDITISDDPIEAIIRKFDKHPSILMINKMVNVGFRLNSLKPLLIWLKMN